MPPKKTGSFYDQDPGIVSAPLRMKARSDTLLIRSEKVSRRGVMFEHAE